MEKLSAEQVRDYHKQYNLQSWSKQGSINPIPVKKAVNLLGFEAGGLRLPLTEMEEAHAQKLEQAMRTYGLL